MILVTGGTGLIGSHLLYYLVNKGERVRALRRKGSRTEEVKKVFSYYSEHAEELFSKIVWAEGDLLDQFSLEDAMKGVVHVYHCAAKVSMGHETREEILRNNVDGTANLLAAAMNENILKFCHVSSSAALGITRNGSEITEETPWNEHTGFSAYALSKYLSEKEVWRASEEGLDVVIVNPTIVIGPGNWGRISGVIFKTAYKGLKWYPGGEMAYVDARDTAKAMALLMESTIRNERFIVSSGNLSYKNFMELVYRSLHKPLPDRKAGRLILELIWRADRLRSALAGMPPVFTKEIARYASKSLSYSNGKIRAALKMDFIPVSESVHATAGHFLSEFSNRK